MNAHMMRFFGLIWCSMTASLAFASGFGMFDTGISPMANAGAFVARAEDGSALFINPAGLAQLGRREIAFSMKFAFQGSHYSNAGQTTWDSDQTLDALPHLVFHDAVGRFAYGFGYTSSHFYDLDWDSPEYPGRFLSTGSTFESREFLGGGAFKITDRFSVGGSLRFVQTQYDVSKRVPQLLDDGFGGALVYEVGESVHGKGDDLGFCLGAQYYKSRWFSMGFSYHSGMTVDLSGDRSFSLASSNGDSRVLDAFALSFSDGAMQSRVWLPQRFSLGVASKVTVRTRLEIDASWDDWSDWKTSEFVFDNVANSEDEWVIPRNMKGVFSLKVAGDFQHRKNLLWRIGMAMRQSSLSSENVEPSFPDADRYTYSGGVSYYLDEWVFEAAYMYHQYRDTKVEGQEFIISAQHPDLIVSTGQEGLFETQKHQFSLGARRRF